MFIFTFSSDLLKMHSITTACPIFVRYQISNYVKSSSIFDIILRQRRFVEIIWILVRLSLSCSSTLCINPGHLSNITKGSLKFISHQFHVCILAGSVATASTIDSI